MVDTLTLAALISRELAADVNGQRTLDAWLNCDYPEILETKKTHSLHASLDDLEELSLLMHQPSVAGLRFDDSDDDGKLSSIFLREKDSYVEGTDELIASIERKKKSYDEADTDLSVLTEDVLPTLHALKMGYMPTRTHLVDLNRAIGNNEMQMPGFDFYTDQKWIPEHLQISPERSESITAFLKKLRDMVRDSLPARVASRDQQEKRL